MHLGPGDCGAIGEGDKREMGTGDVGMIGMNGDGYGDEWGGRWGMGMNGERVGGWG